MPKQLSIKRFSHILYAARDLFIAHGYRLSEMATIATAADVGKGTLYGYVKSKEALFDAVLRYGDEDAQLPPVGLLPLSTPEQGATLSFLHKRIAIETDGLVLRSVLKKCHLTKIAEQLPNAIRDLYQCAYRNRVMIKLVDRCASDYPELASFWYEQARWTQHALLMDYIRWLQENHHVYRDLEPQIASRTILELIAFWAIHRHWEAAPQTVDETKVEDMVVHFVVRGLVGNL